MDMAQFLKQNGTEDFKVYSDTMCAIYRGVRAQKLLLLLMPLQCLCSGFCQYSETMFAFPFTRYMLNFAAVAAVYFAIFPGCVTPVTPCLQSISRNMCNMLLLLVLRILFYQGSAVLVGCTILH